MGLVTLLFVLAFVGMAAGMIAGALGLLWLALRDRSPWVDRMSANGADISSWYLQRLGEHFGLDKPRG